MVFLSGAISSSSVTKFRRTRSSQRISIGIVQQVARQDLQLDLVNFFQVLGFSLSEKVGFAHGAKIFRSRRGVKSCFDLGVVQMSRNETLQRK